MGIKEQLAMARKNFAAAKEKAATGGGSYDREDGRYRVKLVEAEIGTAKNSGRLQIIYSYEFLEGEYAGKGHKAFQGIESETNLSFAIKDLARLGYDIEEFEDIEPAIKELNKKKPSLRVQLKTKGEYQNTYILGMDTGEDVDEVSEATPPQEPTEEDQVVEVGSVVCFKWKGEDKEGTVKAIDEEKGTLKVSCEGKLYPVKAEDASFPEAVVEEEVVEEEEVPEEPVEEVKKSVKKVVKPVAKKKKR